MQRRKGVGCQYPALYLLKKEESSRLTQLISLHLVLFSKLHIFLVSPVTQNRINTVTAHIVTHITELIELC